MSLKIEKHVLRYIKEYPTSKGPRWRIIMADGHGGQIREQGFFLKSEAIVRAIAVFERTLINGGGGKGSIRSNITFANYSNIWMEARIRNGIADNTQLRYRNMIRDFLIPFFGPFKLGELEKSHLRNYIQESQARGDSTYNVSASVGLFKAIVKQALEDDFMSGSEILLVKTPKHKAKRPKFWDVGQMRYFLNAAKDSRWIDLYTFVLWSGLRAGEICALTWDAVHIDKKCGDHTGFIQVRSTCAQKTRKIREATKNGEWRSVPILPELRNLILKMKAQSNGPYVFGGNERLDPTHFSRVLKKDLRGIPMLPSITFHGLRHTFCSYIDSTGMNRRIVSEIMGHRDPATTNLYSHVTERVVAQEIGRWINEQGQQSSNKILELAL